ncbi:heterokaryon incompatibility protein-domain-containing protein [Podospora australis]|uniref:Heterokaryon incompatibility protein-domain-containing protein n=1 Tax=Podospora australis TaxID=1536484 RepID=A0AAN6WU03_9PEZI|nr:heterokaryon incompatibility protein-domain-containing protein [Podospora australis]
MWLIDTESLQLKEFLNPRLARYAILSHTWTDEEVSFQEFANLSSAKGKRGYGKIIETCRLARERDIPYAWVDTCCIDKSSSAELSEAINSMFQWYNLSLVCFVFLEDLNTSQNTYLEHCRWFTRGWTLQELIASKDVEFYDSCWKVIGSRSKLSEITRVDVGVLAGTTDFRTICIAQRMSWAAGRQTTRIEDRAYSLFGLFDVHLPLIYGEGDKAFIRLQEAILQNSTDLSIFAWSSVLDQEYRGLFAVSLEEFASCGGYTSDDDSPLRAPAVVTLTNRGVELSSIPEMRPATKGGGKYYLYLQCGMVLILMRRIHHYVRLDCVAGGTPALLEEPLTSICIPKIIHPLESDKIATLESPQFVVTLDNQTQLGMSLKNPGPVHMWELGRGTMRAVAERHPDYYAWFQLEISGLRSQKDQLDRNGLVLVEVTLKFNFRLSVSGKLQPSADVSRVWFEKEESEPVFCPGELASFGRLSLRVFRDAITHSTFKVLIDCKEEDGFYNVSITASPSASLGREPKKTLS